MTIQDTLTLTGFGGFDQLNQTYAAYEIWRISDPAYKAWPRKP